MLAFGGQWIPLLVPIFPVHVFLLGNRYITCHIRIHACFSPEFCCPPPRYISRSRDLAVAYFPVVSAASVDIGLSVRKRALKVGHSDWAATRQGSDRVWVSAGHTHLNMCGHLAMTLLAGDSQRRLHWCLMLPGIAERWLCRTMHSTVHTPFRCCETCIPQTADP